MLKGKWYNFILLGAASAAFFSKFGTFSWLELYCFVVFSLIVLLLNSSFFKNLNTYTEFFLFLFGAFAVKMGIDFYMSGEISKIWEQIAYVIPFLVCFVLTVLCQKYRGDWKCEKKQEDWKNYFSEREDDLRRLEQIVDKTDVSLLALDASWGQGKSFLLQKFKEDREAQGDIVIVIDVLSLRLDNFQEYLIYELDRTLLSCGYLSRNSNLLRSIMKRAHADILSMILGRGKKHYGEAFYDF
ncbi:P-loop NTPase fold protein [Mitsuokella jalaludinii]|uniref:P-loop NTPase fold protein n=1 Tax=Mitsuokella jalaludinii TaxID=187979 RepID=UPI00298C3859|nr:P-loop NTPase fold protein [Mitsuokella jalaludinii]